jgi:hypothetical protein
VSRLTVRGGIHATIDRSSASVSGALSEVRRDCTIAAIWLQLS